jgi:hypothetical protein
LSVKQENLTFNEESEKMLSWKNKKKLSMSVGERESHNSVQHINEKKFSFV